MVGHRGSGEQGLRVGQASIKYPGCSIRSLGWVTFKTHPGDLADVGVRGRFALEQAGSQLSEKF